MELALNINGCGDPFDLEHAVLGTKLQPQDLSAYARLLLDVFEGNAVLSIRGDEAEESWRIVEPILAGWSTNAAPLLDYPAGTEAPPERS
jgi:glucose-6-phosphate 1-dehydrogenase